MQQMPSSKQRGPLPRHHALSRSVAIPPMPQGVESTDGDEERHGSLSSKINGKGIVQAVAAPQRHPHPYPRLRRSSNINSLAASSGRPIDQTQQFMPSAYLQVPIDQPSKPKPKRKKPRAHPDLSPSASAEISGYLMDTYGFKNITFQSSPKASRLQPKLNESASNSYLDTS